MNTLRTIVTEVQLLRVGVPILQTKHLVALRYRIDTSDPGWRTFAAALRRAELRVGHQRITGSRLTPI